MSSDLVLHSCLFQLNRFGVFVTVDGGMFPQFVRCIFDFAVAALEGVAHSGCAFEVRTKLRACPWPDATPSQGRLLAPSASCSPVVADGDEESPEFESGGAPNGQVKTIGITVGCIAGVGILVGLTVLIGRKVAERLAKDPMDELLEP
jgi:hypothetical protein